MWHATVLTLFPEMFPGPLGYSLPQKAKDAQIWDLDTINIRDYAHNKHSQVDDTPYGGGAGMVMRADILGQALEASQTLCPAPRPLLLSCHPVSSFTQQRRKN